MSPKINFAPITAADAKRVHALQAKLFPVELTESLEEIEEILSNADAVFNCNHSFAVYDDRKMIGYVFAYIDSKSIFHNRPEEVFYIKEFGLLPGYEKYLRIMIFKLTYIWLTFAPKLAMEAHAVEEAKNKWLRLPKIQKQFETILKVRQGDREENLRNNNDADYFFLRWEAGLSGRAEKQYSLPIHGWEFQPGIIVNVISDANRLAALAHDWDKLLQDVKGSRLLSSLGYLVIWWQHFGVWRDLFVVVIRRDNQVIGIAPLWEEYLHKNSVPKHRLSTLGTPMFDRSSQILFGDNEALCAAAMMAFMNQNQSVNNWDVLNLEKQRSLTLAARLNECLPELSCKLSHNLLRNKTLHLGSDYQRFVEKHWLIQKEANSLSSLAKTYDYSVSSDLDTCNGAIEILSQVEEENNHRVAYVDRSPSHYFFYQALVELLAKQEKLRWYVYRKNNKVIASHLGFIEDQVFYHLILSQSLEATVELSNVLLLSAIKDLMHEDVTLIRFLEGNKFQSMFSLVEDETCVDIRISPRKPIKDRIKSFFSL